MERRKPEEQPTLNDRPLHAPTSQSATKRTNKFERMMGQRIPRTDKQEEALAAGSVLASCWGEPRVSVTHLYPARIHPARVPRVIRPVPVIVLACGQPVKPLLWPPIVPVEVNIMVNPDVEGEVS